MKIISKIYSNLFLITQKSKIVLLLFLIQNDKSLLKENGFFKDDVHRLGLEFKNILMEENKEDLDHIKNQEEAVSQKIVFCCNV